MESDDVDVIPESDTPESGVAAHTPETEPGLAGSTEPVADAAPMLERALDMLTLGGPVVMILLAMSIFATALALAKTWQFAVARPGRRREIDRAVTLFREGRVADAQARLTGAKGVMVAPVALAIEGLAAGRGVESVRADAVRLASERIDALRGWMRPLEVIASLAPLLGLFGTVLGMISAFAALETAGRRVDPAILSGGIWEALLTTAVGLAVAIPTVVVVNWFERRVERCEHALEGALSAVFAADMSTIHPAHARDGQPSMIAAAE